MGPVGPSKSTAQPHTIMKVFIALAALAAVALGDHAAHEHHEPSYHAPAPSYHKPQPSYHEPAYDESAAYSFQYGVEDSHSGANFGQNEHRDGYATNGEYRVALPDGRTQIVTYQVNDGYSGYIADVRYEGEAHYPEYQPSYKAHHEPTYKAHHEPTYHAEPVYHA